MFFLDKKYYLIISKSESRFCFLRFQHFQRFSVSAFSAFLRFWLEVFGDFQMNCNTTSFYNGIDPSTTPIETIAERISNHNRISYDYCWDAIKVLDEDPTNAENVILIYSQRSAPKNTSGLSTGWNREHVWPKSYGVGYTGPDFSDLHHLPV